MVVLNGIIEKAKVLDLSKTIRKIIYIHSVEEQVSEENIPYVGGLVSKDTEPLVNTPVQSSAEDITGQIARYFPSDTNKAIEVFKCESSLDPNKESLVDRMKDGRAFSVGLCQHNLTNSVMAGVDCSKSFKGQNSNAVVVNEELYQQCLTLAKNPEIALKEAVKKQQRRGWQPWTYCNNKTLAIK